MYHTVQRQECGTSRKTVMLYQMGQFPYVQDIVGCRHMSIQEIENGRGRSLSVACHSHAIKVLICKRSRLFSVVSYKKEERMRVYTLIFLTSGL